jgi:crotonobetainyl-CoA:carnitine CoA-transferase CaiB-like acyl-CoA transferase
MRAPVDDLPVKAGPGIDLLEGVTVLDLTTSIAGPYAGQLLGDFGAAVIKVERPGSGDDARAWGPPFLDGESLWFQSVNRNKRSVTLDYARPEGAAVLRAMAARTDVVLLNLTARVQRKLGLDAAILRADHPELVHVSITGFGLDGERADLPCYDLIAEGYSGVMDMTGEPDSPPQKVGTPAADMLAGEDAALATVAALFRRTRTGGGATVDVSMIESMARFMSPRLLPYMGSGEVLSRSGGRDSVIAIYQAFDTADLPITLGLGNDAIWKRFWEAVGRPEAATRPGCEDNRARREQRTELVAHIAAVLQTRPRDAWLESFALARVPAGPINRLDEVAADSELRRRGFIYAADDNGRRVPQVGLGIRVDERSESAAMPPPRLGADNQSVFQDWLELAPDEFASLSAAGVIGG